MNLIKLIPVGLALATLLGCHQKQTQESPSPHTHAAPTGNTVAPMQDAPSEVRMVGDVKIEVQGAWARATVAGQTMGGAFVNLTSDRDAVLIGGRSAIAEKVELHTMKMEGEKMLMSPVANIPLPAGQKVELRPGSLHIMFIGLKSPLQEGQSTRLILDIKDQAGKVNALELEVPIKALTMKM